MAPAQNRNMYLTRRFTVGLRGFKVNPALLTYITSGPRPRHARRLHHRRERRIRQRLDAQAIGRLVAEYLAGRTAAKVGEQYGLAKSSVLELVRQAGKSVRHSRLSAHETAQLVALYKAGLPQKDITKRLGRTPSAVWHCLRRRAGLVGAGQNDRPPDSLIET